MTSPRKTVFVLKGYPRLSETFIAQEILGLERAGMDIEIVALRKPTDKKRHPVHGEIRANVMYLPEYLHDDWPRVLRSFVKCLALPGLFPALGAFFRHLPRDWTRNRVRRLGQAFVLAAEMPKGAGWLHAHFIHTPASVVSYASRINGLKWSCSAHAKDIWTSADWDLADKLASAEGVVTCTEVGYRHLQSLAAEPARLHLSYHGLDLQRFSPFEGPRSQRDGSNASNPVIIMSVGRAVEKKGYDVLLRALALLRGKASFHFIHAGGGDELPKLKTLARELGIDDLIEWKGAMAQTEILDLYRSADIFALACRIGKDGDRDGLPNVLVEASSQNLVCVSTNVSGVPELLTDGVDGLVVPPEDPRAFADALLRLIRDPVLRHAYGKKAEQRVRQSFDHDASIRQLKVLFDNDWRTST